MDDQEYNKKLDSLQRYVPFLATMIDELKAKGNREAQLTKFKSLYEMITDTKKRLKIETLSRCEQVLTSIYVKVNPQSKGEKFMSKVNPNNCLPGIESPRSTPRSPSPSKDLLLTKPVTIPTEKVVTATTGINLLNSTSGHQRPKVEVYSNVVLRPAFSSVSKPSLIDGKLPDMSKPPISLDDLKTLEDEVEKKITDAVYQSKTVDELQEVKKQLQLQLKVEEVNLRMSSHDTINTTVRNSHHLFKRRVSTSNEEKSKDKGKNSCSPNKEVKSQTSRTSKSKGEETKVVKQCVMETDLFGNLLSSIDSKILEEKKVLKKSERRSSCSDSSEVKESRKSRNKDKKRDKAEKDKHHKKDKSRDRSSSSKSHSSKRSDKHDKHSSKPDEKTVSENSVTKLLEEEMIKSEKNTAVPNSDPQPVTYKRLADKYNPKPKPKPLDSEIDKEVTESIEQLMKTSPVKSIPIPPLESILTPSQNSTDAPNKPVQLPDILQKIFPKPISSEVFPAVVKHDPRLESITSKVSDITPNKQLNFEPPRFMSPPRVPEPLVSPSIGLVNQTNNLIQPQRIGLLGTPRPDFDSIPHPQRIGSIGTPRADFDSIPQPQRIGPIGTPRADFDSIPHPQRIGPIGTPRVDFDSIPQPQRIGPIGTPRADFDSIPVPEVHPNNQYNLNLPFLPADPRAVQPAFVHQTPVGFMGQPFQPRPEAYNRFDPRFYNNQFPEPQAYYPDRTMWSRDRRPGDPRNYREYKQMKEKRLAAQNKEIKDPRLAARDPRLTTKEVAESAQKETAPIKSAKLPPDEIENSKSTDKLLSAKEAPHSTKFDKIYSTTNKSASSKPGGSEDEESFMSPLDSLYNAGEKSRTGRGYGMQTFRIPKKSNRDDGKIKDKSQDSGKKKTPKPIVSESEESDVDCTDDISASVEDDVDEEPVVTESKVAELGIDISRIKVVINPKTVCDGSWGDTSLKSPTSEDFVSEYDKELAAVSSQELESEPVADPPVDVTEDTSSAQNAADIQVPDSQTETTSVEPAHTEPQTSEIDNTKNDEPLEQNILAHFFENLLKSKNKKDKKTALFSLIETFADSFDNKEIQKIRKIIKVSEDEEDDNSDDDKEERCDTPVTSTIASKIDTSVSEEPPVVGSTTGGEIDLSPDVQTNTLTVNADDNQTQVNEISKSGSDENILPEVQSNEAEPSMAEENSMKQLEPVMVSVGERIKSRKRLTPAKPKKRFRSELDHLHADIKDMFIRDGVLTASGKRMCRLLKDDPNALIKAGHETVATPTTDVQPKKERKKPGPKPKAKRPPVDVNPIKDMRVVLAKMPDEVMITSSRILRSRAKSFYPEHEDEEIPEAVASSSLIEDDSEMELDVSSSGESDTDQKEEAPQLNDEVTHKPKKRRKTPRWAAGLLSKVKKKKPPSRLSNKSLSPEPMEDSALSDVEVDKLVEPDKDYYIDYSVKQKIQCKLCQYTGMTMTSHYLKEHPQSEVLSSRFAPAIATEAVKDFLENGSFWESIHKSKMSTKYQYCCRMCGYASTVLPLLFYEHVTTHTGEYRHQCGVCEFTAANSKTMAAHFIATHPNQEKKTTKSNYTSAIIFAYMCGECNFVQLNRKSVEDHANIFHLGDKTAIFKVNMSTILDPQLATITVVNAEHNIEESPQVEKSKVPKKSVKKPDLSTDESPVVRKKPGPKSKTVVEKSTSEQEVRVRKKPGPKSKTQKPAEDIEENSSAVQTPKELTKKRKRSLDKLISEDSGDDLDSIITLSLRSSRAAKEKATAKLKTMMESNELAASTTSKRKLSESNNKTEDAEVTKVARHVDEPTVEIPPDNSDSTTSTVPVNSEKNQRKGSGKVEELWSSVMQSHATKLNRGEASNIFTCQNDIMQEETKKIEKERLQKMDELNKSIGSRTSNLDFVNKLSNRLTQEESVVTEEIPTVKTEPVDDMTAPVLERQVSIIASNVKKPILEEEMVPTQANITFRQDKPNSLFSNMIEKLQGKVNEAAFEQNENITSENHSTPNSTTVEFSIGELIQVTKCNDDITFSCHASGCHVKTKDKTVFMLHCKFGHKAMTQLSCLCEKCGVVIEVTPDTTLMENLYDHLLFAHCDLLSDQVLLKMRRLSGDKLSIKKEVELKNDFVDDQGNSPSSPTDQSANEAPLQLAEDNPFSFKIANVMSLADTEKAQENPPPIKHVPPLMLIEPAAKQETAMVVKEAKPSNAELARPKKAAKAMQKFIETPGDLYKCPHYYCIFSTNLRTLLAAHLNAHKGNTTAMVRCVYCDMKTPWEHVPMHIDIRHANCRFSCSHCLYRAISTEYVCLHMEMNHPDADFTVIALPPHKSSKKFAVTDHVDTKTLCQPYQCACLVPGTSDVDSSSNLQVTQFLFMTEFVQHLISVHKNSFAVCGHAGCCELINSTTAVSHWAQKHQVFAFQCGYCKFGSNDIVNLYPHFARAHANLTLDILVRKNDFSLQEFRYTDEAFKRLQHKKNLPTNLLPTIGKRAQRSIKLVQLTTPNATPEVLIPADTNKSAVVKITSPKTAASTSTASTLSPSGAQPPKIFLSSPAVLNKLFVATSSTGTGETVLLLSAPLIQSGQQGVQPITSTAPINKVTVQTSTASASQIPTKEPVRLGNITLYPPDPSAVVLSAPTSTMISQPVAVPSTPLFSTAPITTIHSSQSASKNSLIVEEDTTSQNTASSEEDILQSAIRSILEEDGSLFSRPQTPAAQTSPHSPPPLTLLKSLTTVTKENPTIVQPVDLGNVRLELEANETLSNFSDDAFISTNSLDPFVEDPLSITPTFNVNLPPAESQDTHDSLNVSEDKEATVQHENPALITDMRRSVSTVFISDEESDSSISEKKKRGLIGYQLFRCFACNLSFSNVKAIKAHFKTNTNCKRPAPNSYQCVHCDKWLKTIQRLCDHIMTHGVQRFSCSLCEEKFTIVQNAKIHMKTRHGISAHLTSLVPLKSDQVDLDLHEFVLKPAQTVPLLKTFKGNSSPSESAKLHADDSTYTPNQINSIPIRQIFSSNVKCGLCNYQTKVRVNIIRHLQMHLDEKAVPDTAPVNPVPCLEKNEKMFDKMINLAASSITTSGRMGGSSVKEKEKEEEKYPEFVPSHRRYVCCAEGCSYLCPEEGNLKHHLMALHSDESAFTCAHCKAKMETSEIETVIKHFKLHGLNLYKCQSCNFVHNLKHKVERHVSDSHLDIPSNKVVTIRAMDSEPVETQEESGTVSALPTAEHFTSKFKPWSCCMCKVKYHTQQEIQSHVLKKHNVDAQYKCTLCSFKNDEEDSCRDHFKDKHPNHDFDVVLVYQKLEEEVSKEEVAVFDTTPLWQRDKPRVRHIRGILFDDIEPLPHPTKSPKKKVQSTTNAKSTSTSTSPAKTYSSPSSKPSASVPSSLDSSSKNLFDCIDAVARGTTADTSISEPGPSGVSPIKVEEFPKNTQSDRVTSSLVVKEQSPSTDDEDVILLPPVSNVIVINSDDSDQEDDTLKVDNRSEEDDIPKTKDKDSKIKPVAKNRLPSKISGVDLVGPGVKLTKIDETTDDRSIAEACSKSNLIKLFGSLGVPYNKQWKCPKCNQFKSKMVGDFVFHLYKEFSRYRYFCKVCQDRSITYKYMVDHLKLHPDCGDEIFDTFPVDPQLDAWMHMVIREQSLQILDKAPLFRKSSCNTSSIGCYFCNEKFDSMPDCCEHMLYHWVIMPFQCQHCRNEFYTVYDLRHHHKVEHPDAKFYKNPKGPTITKALQSIENFKKPCNKKPAKSPLLSPQAAKKPRLEEQGDNSSIIVVDDPEELTPIYSKPELPVIVNSDEVFACKVCAYVADNLSQIQSHLLENHRVKKGKLFHTLSKEKADRDTIQKYACNMCDETATELNLRLHFIKSHPGFECDFAPYRYQCSLCDGKFMTLIKVRQHFNKNHPGQSFDYKTVVPALNKDSKEARPVVKYSCPYCAYVSYAVSHTNNLQLAIKTHLKGHLRPFECDICKVKFRYQSEVVKHYPTTHVGEPVKFTILEKVLQEYAEVVKKVIESALEERGDAKVNRVAKKSTSAKSPRNTGELDLSKIMTTFEMDDLEYTTTAEQLTKMFNMNTYVDLSGYWVNVVP